MAGSAHWNAFKASNSWLMSCNDCMNSLLITDFSTTSFKKKVDPDFRTSCVETFAERESFLTDWYPGHPSSGERTGTQLQLGTEAPTLLVLSGITEPATETASSTSKASILQLCQSG